MLNAAQAVRQTFPFILREVGAFVEHNTVGELEPRVEEELANGFTGTARIVLRHERILAIEDRVFDFRQAVLKPFSLPAIDVAAPKDNMPALLGDRIDAEAEADECRILRKAVEHPRGAHRLDVES